jgi:hypothetical protein
MRDARVFWLTITTENTEDVARSLRQVADALEAHGATAEVDIQIKNKHGEQYGSFWFAPCQD